MKVAFRVCHCFALVSLGVDFPIVFHHLETYTMCMGNEKKFVNKKCLVSVSTFNSQRYFLYFFLDIKLSQLFFVCKEGKITIKKKTSHVILFFITIMILPPFSHNSSHFFHSHSLFILCVFSIIIEMTVSQVVFRSSLCVHSFFFALCEAFFPMRSHLTLVKAE